MNTLRINSNGKTLQIEAIIPIAVKNKDKNWVAYSPQFKTFGFSSVSKEKALEDFDRAIDLFFQIHIDRNTLEKALEKLRWQRSNDVFVKPKYFNVPTTLLSGELQNHTVQAVAS